MTRDAYAQALIEHARAQSGDREATAVADAMGSAEGPFDDKPQPVDLVISLEGEGAAAYEEFRLAARDLSAHQAIGLAHQAAGQPLLERYRVALARLSAAAVK